VTHALAELGVEVVFGIPGAHNLALWESLRRSGIRVVGVRHEQAAGYAADGYARATGRLGVAMATTGPGAANLVTATGEAWASGSSILVICTDIASTTRTPGRYRGALHETVDQAAFFRPITKAAVITTAPEQLFADVLSCGLLATQAPARPVYLEVPTDYLDAPVRYDGAPQQVRRDHPGEQVVDVEPALSRLARSERPLIWAGGGATASGAGPAVRGLAERLGAPILTSFGGRGLVGPDHPLAVGLPPHLPQVGDLWDSADAVIVVGSDLDAMNTQGFRQPRPDTLIMVDVDAARARTNYAPSLILEGDAAQVLDRMNAGLVDSRRPWFSTQRLLEARAELAATHPDAMAMLDTLDEELGDSATVLADMCVAGYWFAGFGRVRRPRGLAYAVGWGTLGFAFPAGLGASLGTGRPVVSLSGDGGFLYACGELATLAQEDLPLTAIVVDDGGYGMLRYDQHERSYATFGVDLTSPDFVAMARSCAVDAEAVEGFGIEFRRALRRQLALRGPSVLVVRARLTPPPTTSPRWYRSHLG
jgi:thiamine pyrophosphate-dependent acetolactate synthase large subunit-like protein